MTTSKIPLETRARALLSLCADQIAHAREVVDGYDLVLRDLGQKTADWAYARNRVKTASAAALTQWRERGHRPAVIVLAGQPGTGKTAAAARVVSRARGMCVRAGTIDRWSYRGDELGAAKREPMLLIDDVGIERTGSRGSDHLVELICARADAGSPTVITTMFSLANFAEHFPDQVVSRSRPGWRSIQDSADLRQRDVEPDTTAIARLRELVGWSRRVQWAADRTVAGWRAGEEAIVELARIAGLDGEVVAQAERDADEARRRLMGELDQVLADQRTTLERELAKRREDDQRRSLSRVVGFASRHPIDRVLVDDPLPWLRETATDEEFEQKVTDAGEDAMEHFDA